MVASAPNRADIALFVGHVGLRAGARGGAAVRAWLDARNWPVANRGGGRLDAPASAEELLNVPVPVEAWSEFEEIFEARRDGGSAGSGTAYMWAAVRAFFAEGGRRCYVVRVGEPWFHSGDAAEVARGRLERVRALMPGFPGECSAQPADPATWRGIGWVLGLPDVSFVCVPDLPDIVAMPAPPPSEPIVVPPPREQFVECASGAERREEDRPGSRLRAPRCDEDGLRVWVRAAERAKDLLARRNREAQLVLALPLPAAGLAEEALLATAVPPHRRAARARIALPAGIASSFLQLAYPWARTAGSANLPEGIEPPDGVLAGVLARNALLRGAHRSAAGQPLASVHAVQPLLAREQLEPAAAAGRYARERSLVERVSLLGQSAGGMRLLSDVTASADESYRPANVHRLVSAIARAVRRLGEDSVFEPSGEAVWARVRARIEELLLALWRDGGLGGATAADAFDVRCDRTTMRQADIDAGRLIVVVRFQAAAPIERITVALALDAAGGATVLAPGVAEVAA